MRVFLDTAMRLSGMAGLRYHPTDGDVSDLRLMENQVRITLKGGDELWVPLGTTATAAVDRYVRARARHKHADSPWLWLGLTARGARHLNANGIHQMLRRRGQQAGVTHVHPHRWRRTMANMWLEAGGSIDDLMQVAGWKTLAMPLRYTREHRAARARDAQRRLSASDRF